MSLEITGKLYKKFATESKSTSFQTREFVIEIADGNYPQLIKFQLVQERCQLLDSYNEGEELKVHFDLRGREWQGKFLTNLNAWRLEKSSGSTATPPTTQSANASSGTSGTTKPAPLSEDSFPTFADEPFKAALDDDLPF
ncbi:MAG: DUF3127 domain-containing protein [Saprospiraceae bacterium]|nr:DUF3127 domain-containing protein [Saprospiraceae bacterium]